MLFSPVGRFNGEEDPVFEGENASHQLAEHMAKSVSAHWPYAIAASQIIWTVFS
eukprot:SAG11_NODE_9250_length_928_cov_1.913148_1_plen_53_part_10